MEHQEAVAASSKQGHVVSIMKLDTISSGRIIVVNKERESDCVQYHGADLIATLKTLLACENIFGWLLLGDFNCLEKVFSFLIIMMMVLLSNRTNSAEA